MQGHKAGNSLIETKRKNRALIKNTIFRTPDATRTGVAKELGLTLATLSTSVSEMIAEGVLQETERTENTGRTGSGRKALKVVFRPAAALAVGIDLGPYETRGILMDLGGNVLRELSQSAERYSYDRMLTSVEQLIRRLVSGCTAGEKSRICGVAVGVPGVVETVSGRIRATACRSWEGHTLAGDLAERISFPVEVDNNVRMRAYGYEMTRESGEQLFAYLYVSRGIACPVIFGREVISGTMFGAGELGHAAVSEKPGILGPRRTLNESASEFGIFYECQRRMFEGACRPLRQALSEKGILTAGLLTALQAEGDPEVNDIVHDAVRELGTGAAGVINLLNPESLVVDGALFSDSSNRRILEEAVATGVYALQPEEIRVRFLPEDPLRGARGAAYRMLQLGFLDV